MISCGRGAARFCIPLAALAALAAGPATAAAQRLEFDQPTFFGDGVTISPGDPGLVIDGVSLTAAGRPGFDVFAIDNLPGKVGNGSPRLFALNDALVLLASATGNSLDLFSVDFGGSTLAPAERLHWADAIEVTGYRADGSVAGRERLGLDSTVPEPELMTFSFDSQFRGLSLISFHGLGDTGLGSNNHEFTLDNLVVSHAPEPETYALLLAGLGLLAWRRRRRAAAEDAQSGCAD